jgi:predicted DCC family thiol-disulfide oxidoreductase YuxK
MQPIIFFDGVCSVCNSFVDFILRRDSSLFLFASLQGETAKQKLDPSLTGDQGRSIVLWNEQGVLLRSQAVFQIFSQLGWPWKAVRLLSFLPEPCLERGYDFFASHRYQWFGKLDTCRVPSPQERSRFLP